MNQPTQPDILAALPGRRVLVVGDVMLDEYVWGEVRRISPEAPVSVVEVRRRTHVPGGAGNVAANVVALGGVAILVGVVGRDVAGSYLREALRERGVSDEGLVVDPGRPTTTKTRIVAHSQQVVRFDQEQRLPIPGPVEEALWERVEAYLGEADACVLSDYSKGVVSPGFAERFLAGARGRGKPVIVDPKGLDYRKYRGATLIKPNLHEAARVLNRELPDTTSIIEAGRQLLDMLACEAVLITRGPEGMSLFAGAAKPVHIPSEARAVFDVTGAGDTVAGTLALALAAGGPLEQAARLANRAAGLAVAKAGTTPVALDELLGVLSPGGAADARDPTRAPGRWKAAHAANGRPLGGPVGCGDPHQAEGQAPGRDVRAPRRNSARGA